MIAAFLLGGWGKGPTLCEGSNLLVLYPQGDGEIPSSTRFSSALSTICPCSLHCPLTFLLCSLLCGMHNVTQKEI